MLLVSIIYKYDWKYHASVKGEYLERRESLVTLLYIVVKEVHTNLKPLLSHDWTIDHDQSLSHTFRIIIHFAILRYIILDIESAIKEHTKLGLMNMVC
jgi:hypothetical protein